MAAGTQGIPPLESEWVPVDQTKHHLEFAKAADQTPDGDIILVMRDTFSPDQQIPVTGKQFRGAVQAYEDGKLDRLLGGRGGGRGGSQSGSRRT